MRKIRIFFIPKVYRTTHTFYIHFDLLTNSFIILIWESIAGKIKKNDKDFLINSE